MPAFTTKTKKEKRKKKVRAALRHLVRKPFIQRICQPQWYSEFEIKQKNE